MGKFWGQGPKLYSKEFNGSFNGCDVIPLNSLHAELAMLSEEYFSKFTFLKTFRNIWYDQNVILTVWIQISRAWSGSKLFANLGY